MALTPEQTAAILAELSVDLATVTDDRLIELCLLYRSAPSVLPTFTDALATEITRRFTAAEIAANDVMFSVIQNFSNTFDTLANYQTRMYELSTTDVNLRDDWFRDNATFFYELLHNAEALAWLVTQTELVDYISASTVALDTVVGSSVATPVFINSQIAMTAVAASSVALSAIVKSTSARNALMSNNTVFQSAKSQIYNTIRASWSKQASVTNIGNSSQIQAMTAAVANPVGIVLAQVFLFDNSGSYAQKVTHSNGVVALNVTRFAGSNAPSSLSVIDVISFNGVVFTGIDGVVFTGTDSGAYGYAELWIPPA